MAVEVVETEFLMHTSGRVHQENVPPSKCFIEKLDHIASAHEQHLPAEKNVLPFFLRGLRKDRGYASFVWIEAQPKTFEFLRQTGKRLLRVLSTVTSYLVVIIPPVRTGPKEDAPPCRPVIKPTPPEGMINHCRLVSRD